MERKKLEKLGLENRYVFTAKVGRDGEKRGWDGEVVTTILLKDIRLKETGEFLTDHLWFTKGNQFWDSGCMEGDTIEFSARVSEYEKGWQGEKAEKHGVYGAKKDWRLSYPTKVKVIQR